MLEKKKRKKKNSQLENRLFKIAKVHLLFKTVKVLSLIKIKATNTISKREIWVIYLSYLFVETDGIPNVLCLNWSILFVAPIDSLLLVITGCRNSLRMHSSCPNVFNVFLLPFTWRKIHTLWAINACCAKKEKHKLDNQRAGGRWQGSTKVINGGFCLRPPVSQ